MPYTYLNNHQKSTSIAYVNSKYFQFSVRLRNSINLQLNIKNARKIYPPTYYVPPPFY